MTNNNNIDAEELWQLINVFVSGGHLREVRTEGTYNDGSPYSETFFGRSEMTEITSVDGGRHLNTSLCWFS